MKKIILIVLSLILFGCENKGFKINEEITLKGDIDTREIIEDGNYYQIQIISLDEPIIIDGTEINKLEQKKANKIQGSVEKWENYIIEKCSPTESQYQFYEPFNRILKLKQVKLVNCFVYENKSYLEPGDYFGDISYNSQIIENYYCKNGVITPFLEIKIPKDAINSIYIFN